MKNIKKTAAFLAAVLMSASVFTSCGKEATTILGFKEISDDGVSYDLFVPDEWVSDISTGVSAAYYSAIDPSNISVMAFELDNEVRSLPEYWETYEPGLKAVFPDLTYVGEPEETKLDGVPAMQYIYTGTMANTNYKIMQIVSMHDARVHIFTYTAETVKYDEHIEDVLAILDYFTFTE